MSRMHWLLNWTNAEHELRLSLNRGEWCLIVHIAHNVDVARWNDAIDTLTQIISSPKFNA